jgi:hypothetical protein
MGVIARYTLNRHNLIQTMQSLTAGLRHAFAIEDNRDPLSVEEVALLERVANVVVARGMATPAVLFLESLGPMSFLGSQALHFLSPILDVMIPQRDVQRLAGLLERRDTLFRLVVLIESQVEARRTGGS